MLEDMLLCKEKKSGRIIYAIARSRPFILLPLQVYNTPAYTGIYSIVRMAKPRRRPFIQRDMQLSTPDCAPQYTNRNAAVIIQ